MGMYRISSYATKLSLECSSDGLKQTLVLVPGGKIHMHPDALNNVIFMGRKFIKQLLKCMGLV